MTIIKIRLMSSILFMPVNLVVTLPDSVGKDNKKRKVLWLLHGARGDCWTPVQNRYFSEALKNREIITVVPSALNSDYGNYPAFGTGYDFPSFFFHELMPFVYETFPASEHPENQILAGASMGGYGTMALGLKCPEKFGYLAAFGSSLRDPHFLEPYRDLSSEDFRQLALSKPTDFPTEYGPRQFGIKRKEVNVITKYPSVQAFIDSFECMWERLPEVAAAGTMPKTYIACGTEDQFYPTTRDFEKKASELGLSDRIHFHFEPDTAHDEEFFDRQLGAALDWFGL